ncbi:hypothetical protein L21SP5_00278 [Salinivirga cyanobacteriivorans]|uniref:Uncharacterized protein n=1 Tax=Salinivirga cyanobacteriivorans TaxID=1307839 RepID=A0A0S2HVD7_9BACT|nr:hypothetical protein [Salinivirga cyanobacteriivorans]ALO13958.1 hypothetical protein L21SP5_00278 [Salinivirga cyanobacteriivorans]
MVWLKTILFSLLIIVLLNGCTRNQEGVIEYNISYDQSPDDNPLINLMPTSMDFYFKDQKVLTQIQGWMGIFKSIQLSDLEDSTNVLMMKLLDKKYYYVRHLKDAPLAFETLDIKNIEYLKKDTVYKGFNCNRARVYMNDSAATKFDLLYTDEIDIPSPNRNNPFIEVPGVLMQFRMEFKGISLQLDFKDYRDTVFPETTFAIPASYEKISRKEMSDFFNELNAI